jgi:hypothetical protein
VLEAAKVWDAAHPNAALHLRCWFQTQTGARSIECAWTTIEDMRGDAAVFIRAAKGSRDHEMAIPADLASALRAHYAALPERARAVGVLFPQLGKNGRWRARWRDLGARSRDGKDWMTENETAFLRERSGVAGWDPYALRHFRFQTAADRGYSAAQIQRLGGWKSPRTPSVYAKAEHVLMPADVGSSVLPVLPPAGGPVLRILDGGKSQQEGTAEPSRRAPWAGLETDSTDAHGSGVPTAPTAVGGPSHGRRVGGEGGSRTSVAAELLALARNGQLGPDTERAIGLAMAILGDSRIGNAPSAEIPGLVKSSRTSRGVGKGQNGPKTGGKHL